MSRLSALFKRACPSKGELATYAEAVESLRRIHRAKREQRGEGSSSLIPVWSRSSKEGERTMACRGERRWRSTSCRKGYQTSLITFVYLFTAFYTSSPSSGPPFSSEEEVVERKGRAASPSRLSLFHLLHLLLSFPLLR